MLRPLEFRQAAGQGSGKLMKLGWHAIKLDDIGGFTATNPAQQWTIHFDDQAFLVQPQGEADWQWGLSLEDTKQAVPRNICII